MSEMIWYSSTQEWAAASGERRVRARRAESMIENMLTVVVVVVCMFAGIWLLVCFGSVLALL